MLRTIKVSFLLLSPHCRVIDDLLYRKDQAGTHEVRAPRELLSAVAREFDGSLATEDWFGRHERAWDRSLLVKFIERLASAGFLVDARSLPKVVWQFASNPRQVGSSPTAREVKRIANSANNRARSDPARSSIKVVPQTTALSAQLEQRRTTRSFSPATVPADQLAALMWAAYGVTGVLESAPSLIGRTVPSAGALHPLQLYLVNFRESDGLDCAIYSVDTGPLGQPVTFQTCTKARPEAIYRAFGAPRFLENAQAIVVITGDFSRSAEKYGMRSMAYVSIEAGHAAQNVQLAATELDLAALQTGEFVEHALASALGLPESETPLVAIVVGRPGPVHDWPPRDWQFEWVSYAGENAPKPLYTARVRPKDTEPWAWGTDHEAQRAALKAYMEAEERVRLAMPLNLVQSAFNELRNAIDPIKYIAFSKEQRSLPGFRLSPFDAYAQYEWKAGLSAATGQTCFVLADLVYFDVALRHPSASLSVTRYALANSSGVASYDNEKGAVLRGTLELIERDAFMLAWMTFSAPRVVDQRTLPQWARDKIAGLTDQGVKLQLRDISTEFGVALLIFAQSTEHTFTRVSTAAALSRDEALEHALNEIASMTYTCLSNLKEDRVHAPYDTPSGHADFYNRAATFHNADRIVEGDGNLYSYLEVGRNSPQSWPSILASFSDAGLDLIIIDLSDSARERSSIKTVRSLVPGLLPLTFGACYTPLAMPRFLERAGHLSAAQKSSLTQLPHPFV